MVKHVRVAIAGWERIHSRLAKEGDGEYWDLSVLHDKLIDASEGVKWATVNSHDGRV